MAERDDQGRKRARRAPWLLLGPGLLFLFFFFFFPLYTLFRIVIPLSAPGLIASAILTFLSAWGMFVVPLVFSPTLHTKPLTVLIPEFVTKNYVDYGLMNAAGLLAIIPPVMVVIFLNRYLVSGLMAGAGK